VLYLLSKLINKSINNLKLNFMSVKVKSGGKILFAILIAAVAFAAKIFWWDARPVIDQEDTIKIGVVTWPGYAAGQLMNGGFAANTDCRYFKEYGITVEFKVLDDFVASRKAFESDEVDLLWCTVDALPTELGSGSTLLSYNPKLLFQAVWSRGGDAIVVRKGIGNVSDLKGKTIAVAQGTASHTFLIDILKTNSLGTGDVSIQYVPSAIDAANMFKQQAVDAAVVWSPDDVDCVNQVTGSKILASTKTATHIIADGFIVKESYILANIEKLQKLYDGWMVGAAELNANKDSARIKAAIILANQFQMTQEDAMKSMENVRYTTHGDNKNFFGFGDKNAVTGEQLYTKMAKVYQTLQMVDNATSWRSASYSNIVTSSTLSGSIHIAEPIITFTKPTKQEETKASFSNKKVTINFANASAVLDEEAEFIIDRDFLDILKTYQSARIRIEGNTDNTGNYQKNMELSERRAEAVKQYLIKTHGVDPNRIIVVGNGPKHALADGVLGSSEAYRSTDFQLIE